MPPSSSVFADAGVLFQRYFWRRVSWFENVKTRPISPLGKAEKKCRFKKCKKATRWTPGPP
jgi:hypothetical protein